MHSTDPEHYTDKASCQDAPTEALVTARESARVIYATCGGHWRAHRMDNAMKCIDAELASRT